MGNHDSKVRAAVALRRRLTLTTEQLRATELVRRELLAELRQALVADAQQLRCWLHHNHQGEKPC